MKKLLIGLLVPVVIIVGGAATLYFLVRDNSQPTYVASENTTEQVLNKKLFGAIKDTKTTHKLNIDITQDDFNQILAHTHKSLGSDVKEYVKSLEISIQDNDYHIYFFVHTPVLDTKVDLVCAFDQDDDNIYLVINDIKAGILGVKHLALFALSKMVSSDSLTSSLGRSGIHMKADLDAGKFTYPKKSAREDLISMLGSSDGSNLASAMYSNILNMGLTTVDFKNQLSVAVDLEPISTNENFCNNEFVLDEEALGLENAKTNLSTLLKANIVPEEKADTVFEYLMLGYDHLDESEKDYVNNVDMTSIGIANNQLYLGYQPTPAGISDQFASIPLSTWSSGGGVLVTEHSINEALHYRDLIGYSVIFTNEGDVEYITVDNFYINMVNKEDKEQMNMVIGMNINGYETSLILENTKTENTQFGMKLQNEGMYFGTKTVDDNLKDFIYDLIADNLPSHHFLSFDGQGVFTVDFTGYLQDSVIPALGPTFGLDTHIEGTSLDDPNAGFRLNSTFTA